MLTAHSRFKSDIYNALHFGVIGFDISIYLCIDWLQFDFFLFVQNIETLTMTIKPDEGRGRCPYDPYQRNTAIIVGKAVIPQLLG